MKKRTNEGRLRCKILQIGDSLNDRESLLRVPKLLDREILGSSIKLPTQRQIVEFVDIDRDPEELFSRVLTKFATTIASQLEVISLHLKLKIIDM